MHPCSRRRIVHASSPEDHDKCRGGGAVGKRSIGSPRARWGDLERGAGKKAASNREESRNGSREANFMETWVGEAWKQEAGGSQRGKKEGAAEARSAAEAARHAIARWKEADLCLDSGTSNSKQQQHAAQQHEEQTFMGGCSGASPAIRSWRGRPPAHCLHRQPGASNIRRRGRGCVKSPKQGSTSGPGHASDASAISPGAHGAEYAGLVPTSDRGSGRAAPPAAPLELPPHAVQCAAPAPERPWRLQRERGLC